MPFSGIADAAELAMLTKVLDDYCAAHGIEPSSPARLDAGYRIISLFDNGVRTAEELKAGLESSNHGSARGKCSEPKLEKNASAHNPA